MPSISSSATSSFLVKIRLAASKLMTWKILVYRPTSTNNSFCDVSYYSQKYCPINSRNTKPSNIARIFDRRKFYYSLLEIVYLYLSWTTVKLKSVNDLNGLSVSHTTLEDGYWYFYILLLIWYWTLNTNVWSINEWQLKLTRLLSLMAIIYGHVWLPISNVKGLFILHDTKN